MPINYKDRYDNKEKPHFHYVNLNPVGRHTADCVIRAMAMFLDWSWQEVMMELCHFCCENGYIPNYKTGYNSYLICQGIPPQKVKTKLTVKEFLDLIADNDKDYLLVTSNHMTCIKDGRINDTWDCSGRQVKMFWVKDKKQETRKFYKDGQQQ